MVYLGREFYHMKPVIDLIFPPELLKLLVMSQKQGLFWGQKFGNYSLKYKRVRKCELIQVKNQTLEG